MTYPTVLAPWFVVQKLRSVNVDPEGCVVREFYSIDEEGQTIWTDDAKKAMLFLSLHSAYRVALGTAGEIRVVADRGDLTEFRPRGEV